MSKPDKLDQQALQAAKQYMGKVAWPTVLLGVAVSTYKDIADLIVRPILLESRILKSLILLSFSFNIELS